MEKHQQQRNHIYILIALASLIIGSVMLGFGIIRTRRSSSEAEAKNAVTEPDDAKGTVLFLASYSPSFTTFDDEQDGVQKALYAGGYQLDTITMDAKLYSSEEDLKAFHDLMAERLADGISYQGVIAADDAALHFICDYRDELFPDIPVIYFAVNDEAFGKEASQDALTAGYIEDNGVDETLQIATRLLPQAKHIVVVYDRTDSGKGNYKLFEAAAERYEDLDFSGWNFSDHTREETQTYVNSLGRDTILIGLDAFYDSDDNYYSIAQAGKILTEKADIPVFRNGAGGNTCGYTAGAYMDFAAASEIAGEKMAGVLDGTDTLEDDGRPFENADVVGYFYNDRLMRQYDLDTDVFTANTDVVDEVTSFWRTYRNVLIPMIMIGLGLVLFILYSMSSLKQSRKRETDLQTSMDALKGYQENLRWSSEHDNLTGLINRHTAISWLDDYGLTHDHYSIMLIDVDNFKTVNENYGHSNGDKILVELAKRLEKACLQMNCRVYRYGGDEFLILNEEPCWRDDDEKLKAVRAVLRRPIMIGRDPVVPSSSIGIANASSRGSMEDVILDADIAMNKAKEAGKNTYVIFAGEMKNEVSTIAHAKTAIVDALDNDGFRMVYQPKVNAQTGEVCGYESLVRMKRFKLSPGVFIPVAESNGWIRQIGRITTEKTIRQIAAWREEGIDVKPVSINFSSAQLGDRQFIPFLKDLLYRYQVPVELVQIEITESIFMRDSAPANSLMADFEKMGVKLLMDDFGTGYSSLSYLIYIPVSVIKIDKSLADVYLINGHEDFIRDLITLAHDLNKSVTVEGVETKEQYRKLKEFGCDDIQGYYFSKPLDPENIPSFRVDPDKL